MHVDVVDVDVMDVDVVDVDVMNVDVDVVDVRIIQSRTMIACCDYRPEYGDTVEVYWTEMDTWYEGEVINTNVLDRNKKPMFQISYLDGENPYHHYHSTKVRLKI